MRNWFRIFKLGGAAALLCMGSPQYLFAQAVGTNFTVDNITYNIRATATTDVHGQVSAGDIGGSGEMTIPTSVVHPENKLPYDVVSVSGSIGGGVTKLIVSEGIKAINNYGLSLSGSSSLQEVDLPASLETIGNYTFDAWNWDALSNFKTIKVASDNAYFKSTDEGWLMTKDGKTLICVPQGTSGNVTVPEGVTKLRAGAFTDCHRIATINLPASLSSMDGATATESYGPILRSGTYINVAEGNTVYKSIDGVLCSADGTKLFVVPYKYSKATSTAYNFSVPMSVTYIGSTALYSMSNLGAVTFNNVSSLAPEAINSCKNLKTLTFGKGMTTIPGGAVKDCPIAAYGVDEANPVYSAIDGVVYSKDKTKLVLYPQEKADANYDIPDGTQSIEPSAFMQTKHLASVTFPTSLKTIGEQAFRFTPLESATFRDIDNSQLTTIDNTAFSSTSLGTFYIPKSVTTLNGAPFGGASAKVIIFKDGSQITTMGTGCFAGNQNLTRVEFEGSADNLTAIPANCFSQNPNLVYVDIPNKVTTFGGQAFQTTNSLITVNFKTPASIQTISNGCFSESGLHEIVVPEGVTSIEEKAFDHSINLTTVQIPTSTTSINEDAFNFCTSLKAINVTEGNPNYASTDGVLCDTKKKKLVRFPEGKANGHITLTPYFEEVGADAFYNSENITDVTFPNSVTKIDDSAFRLCHKLRSLSFMGVDHVPTLTENILKDCSNEKDITIYVRKAWYDNSDNSATIQSYSDRFKCVHPSFFSATGTDRGAEFFFTSATDVGVVGFDTDNNRTSMIIGNSATENEWTDNYDHTFSGTYNVSSILDDAFASTDAAVGTITVLPELDYIGISAFANSNVKTLYLVSKNVPEIGSTKFEFPQRYPFLDNQTIYVRPSVADAYKTVFNVNGHKPGVATNIPVSIKNELASACYPFDMQYTATAGGVAPYMVLQRKSYTKDDETIVYFRARSIDSGYVPANLAVLLVEKGSESSFYGQMDDSQPHTSYAKDADYDPDNYWMYGAMEDTRLADDNQYSYWYLSTDGAYYPFPTAGATVPFFKTVLRIPASAFGSSSKRAVEFGLDDGTTRVGSLWSRPAASSPRYDLSGRRVSESYRGISIHNGKVVINK